MEEVDGRLGLLTRRTYGMETEYSIVSALGTKEGTEFLLSLKSGRSTEQFISNAGRLYQDCFHPEYATPECTDPHETACYHHAGDVILRDLQRKAADLGNSIELRRDNIDWTDEFGTYNSYGCHENYLTLRCVGTTNLRRRLIPYLVSSPLLFGNGYSDPKGDYHFSVRATILDSIEAESATYGYRSIINTKDEAHLPSQFRSKYSRLHLTCRDANVSEQATFLKVASMSIVLAMIESGWTFDDLMPNSPVEAMKTLNSDIWGTQEVETVSGSKTALMIQQAILSRVGAYLEYISGWDNLPGWIFEAYGLWTQALDDISTYSPNDWPPSSYWIDWWAKWHLLQEYRRQYPDASAEELFIISRQYHDLDPVESLAQELLSSNLLVRRYSDFQLRAAAYNPSTHVRAQERALWVQKSALATEVKDITWKSCLVANKFVPFAFAI